MKPDIPARLLSGIRPGAAPGSRVGLIGVGRGSKTSSPVGAMFMSPQTIASAASALSCNHGRRARPQVHAERLVAVDGSARYLWPARNRVDKITRKLHLLP
jgi:hypothetical protein